MLTYKEIVEQVKASNLPFYRLRGRQDAFTSTEIIIGDNLSADKPTVDSVLKELEESVKRFTRTNPNFVFILELLKAPKSNQGGILGPFLFVKDNGEASAQPKTAAPDPNQFGGLGAIDIAKQMIEVNNSLQQPREQLQQDKLQLIVAQESLKSERREFEKEKEAFKEIVEKATKKSEIAKQGVEKAFWSIVEAMTGKNKDALAGTEVEVHEEVELSETEKLVQSISQNIMTHADNGEIDIEDITKIGVMVQQKINKLKTDS